MKKSSDVARKALREAFCAMVIVTRWGQPCYRTLDGVPQGMPEHIEKKVRAALKALRSDDEKGD